MSSTTEQAATQATGSPPAPGHASPWHLLRNAAAVPEALPATMLVVVVAVFWTWNSAFVSSENLSGILAFLPEVGLIALGMTMLLTAGQFDLSVGAVFGFVPLLVFILVNDSGLPLLAAMAVGLVASAVIGLVNGLIVTKANISSFLVTLSTQLIIGGGALYMSSGFPQSTLDMGSAVRSALVGKATIAGITVYSSVLWFLGIALVLGYCLSQTRLGNWISATGGNPDAARARGIRTDRVTIGLFVLASLLAGFAGIISDLRIGTAFPTAGQGYELEAIAMAVVGGTSLFGGRGTIIGTILGALLLRVIRNGVVLVGVPGLAYTMFVGGIILLAMMLQGALHKFGILTKGGRS
nr:ABC transporter permease [Streptomyces sp. NBC_00886]